MRNSTGSGRDGWGVSGLRRVCAALVTASLLAPGCSDDTTAGSTGPAHTGGIEGGGGGSHGGTGGLGTVDGMPSDAGLDASVPDGPGPFVPDPVTMGEQLPGVVPVLRISIGGQPVEKDVEIPGTLEIFEQHAGTLDDLDAVTPTLTTPIGMQGRGNFTWSLPKKGYGIETQDGGGLPVDLSLLGMPPGNDYALYACYTDKTCLRNALVFAFAQQLGRWSPRTRFVELIVDGEYRGLYMLWERIRRDTHRTRLAKPAISADLGDLTGGYIVRVEGAGKGTVTVNGMELPRDFTTSSGRIYTYHYPDAQRIAPEQSAYIRGFMQDFEDAMASDPDGHAAWLDVPSWVDHAIVEEVTNNWDGYVHSVYMTKASAANGGLLGVGPIWDYDLAFANGNVTGYNCRVDTWAYEIQRRAPDDVAPYWLDLFADAGFREQLACRYQQLRTDALSEATFDARIEAWVAFLADARVRDQARWPTEGDLIFPNCDAWPTYAEEVAALRDWIVRRLAWLDSQLPRPASCRPET